jgi:hypothetical protein
MIGFAKLSALVGLVVIGAGVANGKVLADLSELSSKASYDFVVVGGTSYAAPLASIADLRSGGVGGSVVANRLSENPRHNVLLIEAGPE